ncbi:formate dehydrogenase accessory sulfurtransferase FdhD [Rhizorhapis sp. SPR117]|uniref:formate dehydrogenase accessory sulfurtransferase FdhD n=1 Tax=Rhizorhapis sp. SPR117 TaxID=2912611 RepID=UPI001F0144AD|nr:formate dehydrogenase accessory sulfurtransferase FdhD [Rhizorhapis sp. SPR117]
MAISPPDESYIRDQTIRLIRADGGPTETICRGIAVEDPVSLEFNGIAYAVMMATPADLVDYVTGFALSEKLIETAADLEDVDIHHADNGWIVRTQLAHTRTETLLARVRTRVSESSCGLCGMENLEEVMRPLPKVVAHEAVSHNAIFRALDELAEHQPLHNATGAVHAAAFADTKGHILHAREDVGRHNALDKLIGCLARVGIPAGNGFIITSSRCSYEMVEKALLAGATTLVTISAPTSLAVSRAQDAGLTLIALARPDTAWLMGE